LTSFEGVKSYVGERNFFPKVPFLKDSFSVKIEFVIDFPIDFVLKKRYYDYESDVVIDPFINQCVPLEEYTNQEQQEKFGKEAIENHGIEVTLNQSCFPFPLNPRVMHYSTLFYYDKVSDTVYRIIKTCETEKYPIETETTQHECTLDKKGTMKTKKAFFWRGIAIVAFKKVGENSTRITQLYYANFGGWLSKNGLLTDKIAKKRAENVYESHMKYLSQELTEKEKKFLETSFRGKIVVEVCNDIQ
jgi:hypothetical protein